MRDADPQVVIAFDSEGLEILIRKLTSLRDRIDHLHLMTPAWAGDDLSEERRGGPDYSLVHSLRLVRLTDGS
ncbi:Imm32 family immunity protein [Kaistia terrae]|nr:Imm32 family immunity protein [Kaistia terrae]